MATGLGLLAKPPALFVWNPAYWRIPLAAGPTAPTTADQGLSARPPVLFVWNPIS